MSEKEITLEEQVAALSAEDIAEMNPEIGNVVEQTKSLEAEIEALKKADADRKDAEKKALAEKVFEARKDSGLSEKPVSELIELSDSALKIMLDDVSKKEPTQKGKVTEPASNKEVLLAEVRKKMKGPEKFSSGSIAGIDVTGRKYVTEWE